MPDSNTDEMPFWLNMFEVEAWVCFRTHIAVARASDWYGLAGLKSYDPKPLSGSFASLETALQSGELIANGCHQGGSFAEIPAIEWTRLAIAPLDGRRTYPYSDIRVGRDQLLRHFPPRDSKARIPEHPSGPGRWSEHEMTLAIREYCEQTGRADREEAWLKAFKGRKLESGWTATDFRNHWSIARETTGSPGRQSSASRKSASQSALNARTPI